MKDQREETITYAGVEYKVHPAGIGDPETDRITELICENIQEVSSVAFVECGGGIAASLAKGEVTCFHSNYLDCEYGKENAPEAKHCFGDFAVMEIESAFNLIIFRITKSAAHNLRIVSQALKSLAPKGRLFVAGGNKEGIKGVASKLKKAGVITTVIANGGGGRILEIESDQSLDLEQELIDTTYTVDGKEITVATQEGLFSYGKVDRGSSLLLNRIQTCKKKRVLDLGCGSGILASVALEKGAESVVATDISAMAIDAAKRNLPKDERVEVIESYIGDRFEERFDLIITNPPFHEGKGTTNNLGEEWLDRCKELLSGRGKLLLVANMFLSYNRWGRTRFDHVEELERTDGFVIYSMSGPKRK